MFYVILKLLIKAITCGTETLAIHYTQTSKKLNGETVAIGARVGLTVPGLGLSKVQVVDTVEIHVLCVPCKGAFPHAKIEVWSVDSLDLDPTLTLYSVQNGVQTANVPLTHILQRTETAEVLDSNDNGYF